LRHNAAILWHCIKIFNDINSLKISINSLSINTFVNALIFQI